MIANSGTIAGRTVVALNAQNVHNLAGRIRGADVTVAATNDLNNTGGQIIATDSLVATAGRDLNITSTTSTQSGSAGSTTNIDRVAGLYVSNPGGTLVASAGRDVNIIAGVISNSGAGGNTVIAAGSNLNLGTVFEASSNAIRWNATNFRNDSQSAEVGSQIQAAGNIQLSAGNDLNARAAQVTSSQGALTASAGNSVNITAGESRQSVDEGHQHTSKGFLSKKTTITRETMDRTDAVGSAFSGSTVTLAAGKDINVKGSTAVSDAGTTLVAGNNLSIEAAQNTFSSTSLKDEKRSGIFSGGGLSITAGKQQQSTDTKTTQTTAAASTVGSIGGNVNLQAGEAYKQVGSDVLAPGGDISISAKEVDIIEARETSKTVTEQKFKQSGLTLAITAPVITALQTAQQMSQAAGQTSDGRMQALAAATTALAAKNAYDSVAADPAAAGGLNISLTIGGSKSQSSSTASSDLARGSTIAAGGDVRIVASGAATDSDILVRGSTVQAGNNATLIAEDEIKLLAAANTSQQERSSSGSSGGIGVAFTVGSGGVGFGVTANASASKGRGEGQDISWTNTQVEAGKQLTLLSGGDTTLKGAVAKAETVMADVGGKGAVIASTDKAVDDRLNSFTTGGTLTTSDIQNTASYTGKSTGISVGAGYTGSTTSLNGTGVGLGKDEGNASSTSSAGISGIAGNTAVRSTDAETGLKPIFDADKVQREINAQVAITQYFGQHASKAVGDYAELKLKEATALRTQANNEPDETRAKQLRAEAEALESNWGDKGALRVLAHATIGGLTGGTGGALGAAAGTLTAPTVAQALRDAGIDGPLAQALTAIASTAVGGALGGTAGAGAAANEVTNNYLNHNRPSMLRLSEREQYEAAVKGCSSGDTAACNTRDELAAKSVQRDRELAQACAGQTPDSCNAQKSQAIAMGNKVFTTASGYTYAVSPVFTSLNPSTIGPVPDPRTGTFHDAAARSTAEALLLETGNQVAGAALSLIARGAIVLGKTSMNATVDMLENMALRNVQVGAINNLRSAEAVNATMKSVAGWEPAWQAGTVVADVTLKPGSRVSMVVDETAWIALTSPIPQTERAFGGWATYDNVASQAYARNQLAITQSMKDNVGYVIEVEVTRPIYAQVGVVGGQGTAAGGGNQLHFIVPPSERASTFKFISGKPLP